MRLVTKKEAAQIMGRSCRSIEEYARGGRISRIPQGNSVYFVEHELRELKVQLDKTSIRVMGPHELRDWQRRLTRMEMEVKFLLELTEAKNTAELTDGQLVSLFQIILENNVTVTSNVDYLHWYHVLSSLTDAHLERMATLTRTKDAWKPTLIFVNRLIRLCRGRDGFHSSLDMQRAHALLLRARRDLRNQVFILMNTVENAQNYERIFGEAPDMHEEILTRLR